MRVLVACEESQRVTIEFRKLGHQAFSCDIQPCSGGHPEWHILDDALKVINAGDWDLIIAHPPCTYLTIAGAVRLVKRGAPFGKNTFENVSGHRQGYGATMELLRYQRQREDGREKRRARGRG